MAAGLIALSAVQRRDLGVDKGQSLQCVAARAAEIAPLVTAWLELDFARKGSQRSTPRLRRKSSVIS